jgi:predicted glycoside hydrolase/deacetylase ChbG (UPF0249 family)
MDISKKRQLVIVADDAGRSESIDRGIEKACEAGLITCFDVMVDCMGAVPRSIDLKQRFSNIDLGLHVDIGSLLGRLGHDDTTLSVVIQVLHTRLFRMWLRKFVSTAIRKQLICFKNAFGFYPDHISGHIIPLLNSSGYPKHWLIKHIDHLFSEATRRSPIRGVDTIPVRHHRLRWLFIDKVGLGQAIKTPEQFARKLKHISDTTEGIVELIVHPGDKIRDGDKPLRSLFTAGMRNRDLEGLRQIISSGVIESAGFELLSPSQAFAIK